MIAPAASEAAATDLDAELDRRCIEDGEALSDLLTFYVYLVGVDLIDDCEPPPEEVSADAARPDRPL